MPNQHSKTLFAGASQLQGEGFTIGFRIWALNYISSGHMEGVWLLPRFNGIMEGVLLLPRFNGIITLKCHLLQMTLGPSFHLKVVKISEIITIRHCLPFQFDSVCVCACIWREIARHHWILYHHHHLPGLPLQFLPIHASLLWCQNFCYHTTWHIASNCILESLYWPSPPPLVPWTHQLPVFHTGACGLHIHVPSHMIFLYLFIVLEPLAEYSSCSFVLFSFLSFFFSFLFFRLLLHTSMFAAAFCTHKDFI